jgi:hypothetical protein
MYTRWWCFIWPVVQDYQYLDLKPLSIEANLTNALSRQNIHVVFRTISTESKV